MSSKTCKHCPKFTCGKLLKAYLGLVYTDADGNRVVITEAEFAEFLPVISAAFPNGWTIYNAIGGFLNSSTGQTEVEGTKVLEIVVPKSECETSVRKFSDLVDQYSIKYHQSSEFWHISNADYVSRDTPTARR